LTFQNAATYWPRVALAINDTANKTKNITNSICAIPADADAMPPKPITPATIATMKNTTAQYSMINSPYSDFERAALATLCTINVGLWMKFQQLFWEQIVPETVRLSTQQCN